MLEWGIALFLIGGACWWLWRMGAREARCKIAAATRKKQRAIEQRAAKTHEDMASADDDTIRRALRGDK